MRRAIRLGSTNPSGFKYMCDQKCNEEDFTFYELQPLWRKMIASRTRSISSKQQHLRRKQEAKQKYQCRLEGLICDKRSRDRLQKNVGTVCGQTEVGKNIVGRSNENGAAGDKEQLAK